MPHLVYIDMYIHIYVGTYITSLVSLFFLQYFRHFEQRKHLYEKVTLHFDVYPHPLFRCSSNTTALLPLLVLYPYMTQLTFNRNIDINFNPDASFHGN